MPTIPMWIRLVLWIVALAAFVVSGISADVGSVHTAHSLIVVAVIAGVASIGDLLLFVFATIFL